MANSGIRTTTSGFPTAVAPDASILHDTNNSADMKSGSHGQFQEKEKNCDYWIEKFPFEFFFDENNKDLNETDQQLVMRKTETFQFRIF